MERFTFSSHDVLRIENVSIETSHKGLMKTALEKKGKGMMNIETLAIHADHGVDPLTGAIMPPIHLSTRGTSLGGVESLIEHRASIEGPNTRTPDNLLRLSIGLEHPHDLIEDLTQALEGAKVW